MLVHNEVTKLVHSDQQNIAGRKIKKQHRNVSFFKKKCLMLTDLSLLSMLLEISNFAFSLPPQSSPNIFVLLYTQLLQLNRLPATEK